MERMYRTFTWRWFQCRSLLWKEKVSMQKTSWTRFAVYLVTAVLCRKNIDEHISIFIKKKERKKICFMLRDTTLPFFPTLPSLLLPRFAGSQEAYNNNNFLSLNVFFADHILTYTCLDKYPSVYFIVGWNQAWTS